MEWWQVVESVKDQVVQISTPRGSGTGFVISQSGATGMWAIATAAHVVNDSNWWEEPIRLYHPVSGKTQILRPDDRAIVFKHEMDTAAILFTPRDFPIPNPTLQLIPDGNYLKVGNEIGWLGFPAVSPFDMCFFTGRASAWLQHIRTYLVDGVAINGASGGPALTILQDNRVYLIGVVSAYIPNRATGEALPGLSMVRDVTQYQELAKEFRTLDDASKTQNPQPPSKPTAEAEPTKR